MDMESLSHSSVALAWLILATLTPLFALLIGYQMKTQKRGRTSLLVLLGLQLCLTGVGHLGLGTGEIEEERVEGVVEKKIIQSHESNTEIAVGLGALATIFTITVIFIRPALQANLLFAISILGFLSTGLGIHNHLKGKDLARAKNSTPLYDKKSQEVMEKAPGTFSSSSAPTVNESLKPDENDYETNEEDAQLEDDEKQED